MPINHKASLPFKDVWAAPGTAMYEALESKDFEKARKIYDECESARLNSYRPVRKDKK